ncbi:cyclic nucleotide-binding domain-containing protein [Polaromonas sp. P1(28)-13]|nr:cyclic nucleotide-binding domain-containing protein [Polaromonas sp. P1(28)-13]
MRENLARVSFPKDAVILTPEMDPAHVYVLISGHVQQTEAGEAVAVYGPADFLAFRAVMAGRASGVLVALDEVEAWQISRATALALISGNAMFSAMVFADLSRRLTVLAESRKNREFFSLLMVRIRDACIRKPFLSTGAGSGVGLQAPVGAGADPCAGARRAQRRGTHRPVHDRRSA